MVNSITPPNTPNMTQAELLNLIQTKGYASQLNNNILYLVGIRGYYKNTMGVVGINDRGIYDDAIFLCSPNAFACFNANTDPSIKRPGFGKGKNKGMACLKVGLYKAHAWDKHKGKYSALCQRTGEVTVIRDGIDGKNYEDQGYFGINIHKGKIDSTSSEGCQTIPPKQWDKFIGLVKQELEKCYGDNWNTKTVPYLLLDISTK